MAADLGKYLGVPLHHGKLTKESFHYLVDKVKTRLTNFSANCLYVAGRSTLISPFTLMIPNYTNFNLFS